MTARPSSTPSTVDYLVSEHPPAHAPEFPQLQWPALASRLPKQAYFVCNTSHSADTILCSVSLILPPGFAGAAKISLASLQPLALVTPASVVDSAAVASASACIFSSVVE